MNVLFATVLSQPLFWLLLSLVLLFIVRFVLPLVYIIRFLIYVKESEVKRPINKIRRLIYDLEDGCVREYSLHYKKIISLCELYHVRLDCCYEGGQKALLKKLTEMQAFAIIKMKKQASVASEIQTFSLRTFVKATIESMNAHYSLRYLQRELESVSLR